MFANLKGAVDSCDMNNNVVLLLFSQRSRLYHGIITKIYFAKCVLDVANDNADVKRSL